MPTARRPRAWFAATFVALLNVLSVGCQQTAPAPELASVPAHAFEQPARPPHVKLGAATRISSESSTKWSTPQIALIDRQLESMLAERSKYQQDITAARAAGLMDENPRIKQLQTVLDLKNKQIEQYTVEWNELRTRLTTVPEGVRCNGFTLNARHDIYFDPADLNARKPSIAGAQFIDTVLVSGRTMFKFSTPNNETWLVDPTHITAIRTTP